MLRRFRCVQIFLKLQKGASHPPSRRFLNVQYSTVQYNYGNSIPEGFFYRGCVLSEVFLSSLTSWVWCIYYTYCCITWTFEPMTLSLRMAFIIFIIAVNLTFVKRYYFNIFPHILSIMLGISLRFFPFFLKLDWNSPQQGNLFYNYTMHCHHLSHCG